MNEMKLAAWRFPAAQLPAAVGVSSMLDIDLAGHPDMVGHLADWEPFSHQIFPVSEGEVLLTVMLRRRVEAPDSPEGI